MNDKLKVNSRMATIMAMIQIIVDLHSYILTVYVGFSLFVVEAVADKDHCNHYHSNDRQHPHHSRSNGPDRKGSPYG